VASGGRAAESLHVGYAGEVAILGEREACIDRAVEQN
jgi:hypothetical protein